MSSQDKKVGTSDIPQEKTFDRYDNYKCQITSEEFTRLFNHLTGQILTLIEASTPDKTQRESLKQIAKERIWSNYEEIQHWMYNEENRSEDKNSIQPIIYFPF